MFGQGKPIDQSEFARGFQAVLRVFKTRQRPFYNTRHTYISVALALGCNQKWIAEQTGTSMQMIQEHYGKYIRGDGDARLRAYVAKPNLPAVEQKTGTFAGTFSQDTPNYRKDLVRPTGIEPVLRVPETLVISFSLRARGDFFYHRVADQSTRALTTALAIFTISS